MAGQPPYILNKFIKPDYAHQFSAHQPYFGPGANSVFISVPVAGWDAISPLSAMPPQYGIILDNIIPRPGFNAIRGGYNAWCQAISDAPVETLFTYRPPTGTETLFAASNGSIFDASLYGSFTEELTGFQNDRWQTAHFTPAGGSTYGLWVNGEDPYMTFDGTTWTEPTITGVSSSTFVNVAVWKRRLWFVQKDTTKAWYLDTDAIQGAANLFDLGPLMDLGGTLLAIGTITVDGGNGPDDLLIFVTSQGQVIVYKGTNPANANMFSLVGVFYLPEPIGHRCIYTYGADALLITNQGVLPVTQSLPLPGGAVRDAAITKNIQNAMLEAAQMASDNFGWQLISFYEQSLLILNVPIEAGQTSYQFVMEQQKKGWCRFTGWNATCFEIFNDSLYFGDNNGNVNLGYTGGLDLVNPIAYELKTAFNYLDPPNVNKYMTMIRPYMLADGTITPSIGIDVDYENSSPTSTISVITPSGALWDVGLWDVGIWSGGLVTVNNWVGAGAIGTVMAVHMSFNLAGTSSVQSQSVFDTGVFDEMVFDGNGSIIASGQNIPTLQIQQFEAIINAGGAI